MSATPSSPLRDRPWLSSYAPGVPHEIDPVTETLVDLLDGAVSRYGRKVALEFFGAQTRYDELGEQVSRAANALRKLGVRAGDRVALVLPNCPQHVVAFYAVLRLGAVVVEHIFQAVVKAVGPALPELKYPGRESVSAPERRQRHRLFIVQR